MMNLKDLLQLQAKYEDRAQRIKIILSAMTDPSCDDEARRVRIDGQSAIWMPLVKLLPVLEVEQAEVQAELDKITRALDTAREVANGMINKSA